MYLSRILTNRPLKEIGEAFGGRDHGTVIHACKTVENLMEQDESVRRNVDYLTKQITGQLPLIFQQKRLPRPPIPPPSFPFFQIRLRRDG